MTVAFIFDSVGGTEWLVLLGVILIVVGPKNLPAAARKFAIVLAFFLGMVLTPPDPMSQIVMALPLCLLYEASIWAVWLKETCSGERWRRGKEAK